MTITLGVPSLIVDHEAPLCVQHLAADANDAIGRLATTANDANAELEAAIEDVAADVPAAAAQSDQETATSTTTYVSPGRQHFHPSSAKVWAKMDMAAATSAAYNVTSITDVGVGIATVTIADDFSSADYCVVASTYGAIGNSRFAAVDNAGAAGSITIYSFSNAGALSDPTGLMVVMFGDQ